MFSKETYVSRRKRLAAGIDSGIILLLGTGEAPYNYPDNTYKYRQDSTFNYFFGLCEPDLAAVIDVESGEEIIFGNDVDIDDIIWMGPQALMKDKAAKTGVSKTAPLAELDNCIAAARKSGRKIHYLPPFRYKNMITINRLLDIPFDKIKSEASVDLIKAVVALRLIKEDCEIAELDKAADLGYKMHYAVMKAAKPGVSEQELVGLMEGIACAEGLMPSFPIILSQNGETLHNHSHNQILTEGRLLVIDAGAEINSNYVSDFTRTLPCSGKFTQKQKDIYNIVLDANNFAFSITRPGITYQEVHQAMSRRMAQGYVNLGILKGDVDEIVAAGAHSLFMPHGLGHAMGLDCHDMEDLGQVYVGYDDKTRPSTQFGLGSLRFGKTLEKGHVISNEPGAYFIPALIEKWKKEGINTQFINFDLLEKEYYDFGGIRLEDDVLVTADGARRLGSKRLPVTVEEIEEVMRK